MQRGDAPEDAKNKPMKCLVVGAGPVGALAALYAAKRGWQVEVYELRGDLREASTTPLNFTKSINLALSERGINGMRHSGSEDLLRSVLQNTVPMYGRMIHGEDSKGRLTEESQQYDVHGRPQLACDRADLNMTLLDQLESLPNVQLLFHHKLTGADFRRRRAWFERTKDESIPSELEVNFDLILGCDGAHSSVRYHMMKFARMDYQQSYIDTLWCEFTIPSTTDAMISTTPSAKEGWATSPNHLHIWPGSDDMFIAIPSVDKTFTCTLFAPSCTFADLERIPEDIEVYFREHFPGVAGLVGITDLAKQFKQNPHLPLISIKCSPHHYSSSGVILGDAAHAMVPFYGQGMNAGLEDVRVLFEHLDAHPSNDEGRIAALDSYTKERVPDAHTINDLALANYWEMHAGVRDPLYLVRKSVEEFLSDKVPSTGFVTQYTRVSFSNQRYSEVAKAVGRQRDTLLGGLLSSVLVPVTGLLVWFAWRSHSARKVDLRATGNILSDAFSNGFRK